MDRPSQLRCERFSEGFNERKRKERLSPDGTGTVLPLLKGSFSLVVGKKWQMGKRVPFGELAVVHRKANREEP